MAVVKHKYFRRLVKTEEKIPIKTTTKHVLSASRTVLTLDQAQTLVTQLYDQVKSAIKPRSIATIEERRSSLHTSINTITSDQQILAIRFCSLRFSASKIWMIFEEYLKHVSMWDGSWLPGWTGGLPAGAEGSSHSKPTEGLDLCQYEISLIWDISVTCIQ